VIKIRRVCRRAVHRDAMHRFGLCDRCSKDNDTGKRKGATD
jgi:hypothetical protein